MALISAHPRGGRWEGTGLGLKRVYLLGHGEKVASPVPSCRAIDRGFPDEMTRVLTLFWGGVWGGTPSPEPWSLLGQSE